MSQADSSLSSSTSRRQVLRAVPLLAATATVAAAASSELLELIATHRRLAAEAEIAERQEHARALVIGVIAAEQEFQNACLAHSEAMAAICELPVRDMQEARVKAAYLIEHIEFDEFCRDEFKAFIASFLP